MSEGILWFVIVQGILGRFVLLVVEETGGMTGVLNESEVRFEGNCEKSFGSVAELSSAGV